MSEGYTYIDDYYCQGCNGSITQWSIIKCRDCDKTIGTCNYCHLKYGAPAILVCRSCLRKEEKEQEAIESFKASVVTMTPEQLSAKFPKHPKPESHVLDAAKEATRGERHESYGTAFENMQNTARLFNAYLRARKVLAPNTALNPEDIPILMMLVKIARQAHAYKLDNLVDIAGYADVCERVVTEDLLRNL